MSGDSSRAKRSRQSKDKCIQQDRPTGTFPWPRAEGMEITAPIDPRCEKGMTLMRSPRFLERPFTEAWDAYDSALYNAWLKVKIVPTRFICRKTLEDVRLLDPVERCIEKLGLGTMPFAAHDLYPDLVRQFMASVRVRYTGSTHVHFASTGFISFKIKGIRYELSFSDLCSIYGFHPDAEGCILPGTFSGERQLWQLISGSSYFSKKSTQTSIRHPVLRILGKVLSNSVLCKPEANKMRVQELVFLHYAVGHLVQHRYPHGSAHPAVCDTNLGAIFAHHLVDSQRRPFKGGTSENVGSLLTPLFMRVGVDFSGCERVTRHQFLDAAHLKAALILRPGRTYHFSMRGQQWALPLPAEDLTTLDSEAAVYFEPPESRLRLLSSSEPIDVDSAPEDAPEPPEEFELTADDEPAAEWPPIVFPPEIAHFAPSPPPADLRDTVAYRRHQIREQRKQSSFLAEIWRQMTCRGGRSADAESPRQRSRSPR